MNPKRYPSARLFQPQNGSAVARLLYPLLALLLFTHPSRGAAPVPLSLEDYTYPEYYDAPNETQIKSLLKGARAQPLDPESNRALVTKARLESFRTNGAPWLIVEADQCVSDKIQRTVNSSEALRVFTPDGKFFIEGIGFLWLQTNSFLHISNRVHTIAELPQNQAKPGETPPAQAPERIEIFSDRFHCAVDEGLGIYTGRLRVTGTNLTLTGGILTAKLPAGEEQHASTLEYILIETNVVVDYINDAGGRKEAFHVTGATADYSPAKDVVHVKGHPTWRADKRTGSADELILDRTNKVFTGIGHGWLKMPGESGGGAGFLAQPGPSVSRDAKNRFVEIVCNEYQLRTNLATFQGPVEVHDLIDEQVKGAMNCGRMTISFSGTNELQRMVADDRVIIQEGTNRLSGGHAIYTATNGLLELTDLPGWKSGSREGKGDIVQAKLQQKEMTVRGHAYVRMPAESLSHAQLIGLVGTNRPTRNTATNEFAEITSDSYTLSETNGYFRGGVRIQHPQVSWDCGDLAVHWPNEGGRVDRMVAQRSVRFQLTDEKGQKTSGRGDEAVYTYGVTDGVTNEVLKLTGSPASLVGTNGVAFRNPTILYDMARKQVIASGSYRFSPPTNAVGSNTFLLPRGTFSK